MTNPKRRVAIVFPADAEARERTQVESSRLAEVAAGFVAAGAKVISAPYADDIADETERQLQDADAALVWYNPVEAGRDRSGLNRLLRTVAERRVMVSAHPDVIDRIGTKEVLYETRKMGWGCDTRRYGSLEALRNELPASLVTGPRVLKQMRGQSGDGVWKVEQTGVGTRPYADIHPETVLSVRHAKRGCIAEQMPFDAFVGQCRPYFEWGGAMIDQPYQQRLIEGMIRCYIVRDRVAGFGEQLINALFPAPEGRPESEAPLPGPRLYFPPDRGDLQTLKERLEHVWITEMCDRVGLRRSDLPVLWDADFLRGPLTDDGVDTFVLCEINVSSVYPFPPTALLPLVNETLSRYQRRTTCIGLHGETS